MSTQRYISTSFWDDPWVHSLTPNEKLLYLHLMTCPLTNIAGVYELTNDRIAFDTGLKQDTISKAMDKFQKDKKAYRYDMYIIIRTWPKHQKWEQRSKIQAGIEKILIKLDSKLLSYLKDIGYTYPIDSLPITYLYVPSYSDLELDSDLELESNIDKDIEVPEQNHKYGEYSHVLLTDKQYSKLLDEWGEEELKRQIVKLDEGIQMKGYKYKDHNLTIRSWKKNEKQSYQKPEKKDNFKRGGINFEL